MTCPTPDIRAVVVISGVLLGLGAAGCGQQEPSTPQVPPGEQLAQQVEDLKAQNRALKRQLQIARQAAASYEPYTDKDAEIDDLREQVYKARNAPDEGGADDLYLDEGEWRQGLAAAERTRRSVQPNYVARVTDMRKFVNSLSEQPGIYWSAEEKAAFRLRYADWYARNK